MPRQLNSTLGTVAYNGYVFNNKTRTKRVEIRPEPDGAGRITKYLKWTIELETHITATTTTDPEVQRVAELLTHRGGVLVFRGRGLGNPDVNTGRVRDLKWGPEPAPVRLDLVGPPLAVKLTWGVSFVVPCCQDAKYQFGLVELVYSVEHETDDAGFASRRVAGYLSIPNTRKAIGDTDVPDSPDNYRDRVTLPLLKGFRRRYGPWVTNEDRTKLSFSIIDEQMGGEPLPPNVVEAELSESVSSTAAGLMKWQSTISGNYRMRYGATGLDAARAFFAHVDRTLRAQRDELRRQRAPSEIIPIGFHATNPNRYGKPAANFSFQYTFTVALRSLLLCTGLWTQRGPDRWETWARSLIPTAFNPYGGARLLFKQTDDELVGLCEPTTSTMTGGTAPLPPIAPPAPEPVTQAGLQQLYDSAFKKPEPSTSWVGYESEIWVEFDSGFMATKTMPKRLLDAKDDVLGAVADFAGGVPTDVLKIGVGAAGLMPSFLGGLLGAGNELQNIMEDAGSLRRTKTECYVYVRGWAVRAGFVADPPRLLDVNGVTPVPANRLDRGEGFGRGVRQNGTVPLHYTRWNLRYYLPALPTAPLPDPPNPLLGEKPKQQ